MATSDFQLLPRCRDPARSRWHRILAIKLDELILSSPRAAQRDMPAHDTRIVPKFAWPAEPLKLTSANIKNCLSRFNLEGGKTSMQSVCLHAHFRNVICQQNTQG